MHKMAERVIRRLLFLTLLLGLAVSCVRREAKKETSADLSGSTPPGAVSPIASTQKDVPNFRLNDVNGNPVSLADYRGKVVLVDFWATWCGPCRQEIPHLKDLYAENRDRGFVILAIAMDENGVRVVPPFVKAQQISYKVLLGTPEVEELFGGIVGYPTTFLIDRSGQVVDKTLGYRPKQYFEERLKTLL